MPISRCVFCNGGHSSDKCRTHTTFVSRYGILRNNKHCFLCLRKDHCATNCTSKTFCSDCEGPHNISICKKLLDLNNKNHYSITVAKEDHTQSNVCDSSENISNSTHCLNTLLQTANATAVASDTELSHKVNILFDTGSHRTYVTTDIANKLNLIAFEHVSLNVCTFMNKTSNSGLFPVVNFILKGLTENISVNATVVPFICKNAVVTFQLPIEFRKLVTTESSQSNNNVIDVLVGMDLYWQFMKSNTLKSQSGLFASETIFGWTVSGSSLHASPYSLNTKVCVAPCIQDNNYDSNLETLVSKLIRNDYDDFRFADDTDTVQRFLKCVSYSKSEKCYTTRLPWKPDLFPHNHLDMCERRLTTLYHKLKSKPDILTKYDIIIQEQLNSDIIEIVEEPFLSKGSKIHYMPHHCILRLNKPTTKVRIVYDGSFKRYKQELSLNDCLYVGPQLIRQILPLLIRFRLYRYAITSDIKQAFLNVRDFFLT